MTCFPSQVNRFANPAAVYDKLREYLDQLDRKHGPGGYVLIYGGDPYNPERPDVAALMHFAGKDGVHVVAVQCDEYADYMRQQASNSTYKFVEAACFYATQRDEAKSILCEHREIPNRRPVFSRTRKRSQLAW